jgi:hypothetical protein
MHSRVPFAVFDFLIHMKAGTNVRILQAACSMLSSLLNSLSTLYDLVLTMRTRARNILDPKACGVDVREHFKFHIRPPISLSYPVLMCGYKDFADQ